MTAEFAVLLPAALAVVLLSVTAIMLATQRVILASAAADIARLEARGDRAAAEARYEELGPGVRLLRRTTGHLLCVELQLRPGAGLLAAIAVEARACAAVIATGREGAQS